MLFRYYEPLFEFIWHWDETRSLGQQGEGFEWESVKHQLSFGLGIF